MFFYCKVHLHKYTKYFEIDLIGSKTTNRKYEKFNFFCLGQGLISGAFFPESSALPSEPSLLYFVPSQDSFGQEFNRFNEFYTDLLETILHIKEIMNVNNISKIGYAIDSSVSAYRDHLKEPLSKKLLEHF